MYKNVLRQFNFLLFALLVIAVAVIQSTFFGYYPLMYLKPDLIFILAVYLGLKRTPLEGGMLVILASAILETHSGVMPRHLLTLYLYTFIFTVIFNKVLVVSNMFAIMRTIAIGFICKQLGLLYLASLEQRAGNLSHHILVFLVPDLFIELMLTPFVFSFLQWIDLKTFKDVHAEDEYDINKGY